MYNDKNKKIAIFIIVFLMITMVGCTGEKSETTYPPNRTASRSISTENSSDISTTLSTAQFDISADEYKIISFYPPLDSNAAKTTVPDFFTEEQKTLYRHAYSVYSIFNVTYSIDEYSDDPDNTSDADEFMIDGRIYIQHTGIYARWDDFEKMALEVFTEEYFNELIVDRFLDIDGNLYYGFGEKGSIFGYAPDEMPDTFKLLEKSDDRIKFNMIAHYYTKGGTEPRERYSPEDTRTESFPMELVLTDAGWRFSEFALARG